MPIVLKRPKTVIKQLPTTYTLRFSTYSNPMADAYCRWLGAQKQKKNPPQRPMVPNASISQAQPLFGFLQSIIASIISPICSLWLANILFHVFLPSLGQESFSWVVHFTPWEGSRWITIQHVFQLYERPDQVRHGKAGTNWQGFVCNCEWSCPDLIWSRPNELMVRWQRVRR